MISRDLLGILFDLDGTLTDYRASAETGLRSAYEVLRGIGSEITFAEFEAAYRDVIQAEESETSGSGIRYPALENRRMRFDKTLSALHLDLPSVTLKMAGEYGVGRVRGAVLVPGVHEVLGMLSRHYKLGLLTEGSEETQMSQIKRNRLGKYFTQIVISGETGYHKPQLELYRLTAGRMGIKPGQIAMVGDRIDWDLVPAKRIGMTTIWIGSGGVSDELEPFVDHTVPDIADLQELFQLRGRIQNGD
ncbi:HAD-IA family hydrolase [bacterium]|nr:HAD-IA family hydrolase [candidate division CSSED10-310 bacterium]